MVRPRSLVVASFALILGAASLYAGDLRIPIPKKSKYTPVQALNRDGVKAVEHHQYDKAKKLFYKAYLIDPNDPFTLNNLGYMAEIEGDADRARRFYALSAEMGSDAIIDKASNEVMEGKPVSVVAGRAEDKGIKINRLNNQAIALLQKDRAPEADLVLQKALTVDSGNPFTLNNLGYAKEKEGELDAAYQFYTAAANRGSQEKVEVAIDKDWRGKAISDVARDNAKKLNKRLQNFDTNDARVAILNLRGVSALNRNDRRAGREFIQKAFKLDPADAFTLNNMGYLAELEGDKETADFYYERAREANQSNEKVAVATNKEVEGQKIGLVADNTDQLVQQQMEVAREARQRQGGPVVLMRRDKSAVVEPPKPAHEPTAERVSDENGELKLPPLPRADNTVVSTEKTVLPGSNEPASNQPANQPGGVIEPLPDNEQPTTVKEGPNNGGMLMPLPDAEQPAVVQPKGAQPYGAQPAQPESKEGTHDGGMIMPLPDDQQPGAQPNGTDRAQPQPKEGQHDGGMIMPLPDNQQPGSQPNNAQPAQPQRQAAQPSQPVAPPVSTQPVQPAPRPQTTAPSQSQPQLLLPPPDKQQAPQGQSNSIGAPSQPQHISDQDQPKQKKSTDQQKSDGVKKITDQ